MTNENKDKIIDKVIDFLHNKPLKSDMRIAAALIEELKLVKNCSIPDVVGRSEQLFCQYCGHKKSFIVSTDINSGTVCKNRLCKGK
jgi:hypothetical protein